MTIKFYYQYISDGVEIVPLYATITSAAVPGATNELYTTAALSMGIKKFDPQTREVIFYINQYDEQGEITDQIEDPGASRIVIPVEQILP